MERIGEVEVACDYKQTRLQVLVLKGVGGSILQAAVRKYLLCSARYKKRIQPNLVISDLLISETWIYRPEPSDSVKFG